VTRGTLHTVNISNQRVFLNHLLRKLDYKRFNWLRTEASGGLLRTSQRTKSSINEGEFIEKLSHSQLLTKLPSSSLIEEVQVDN
jgi:hypothetical protein